MRSRSRCNLLVIIRVLIVSTFKLTRQERFYLDHRLEPQNTLSSVTSEADGHCGKPDARAWSSSHGMTSGQKEEENAVGETDSIYSRKSYSHGHVYIPTKGDEITDCILRRYRLFISSVSNITAATFVLSTILIPRRACNV